MVVFISHICLTRNFLAKGKDIKEENVSIVCHECKWVNSLIIEERISILHDGKSEFINVLI